MSPRAKVQREHLEISNEFAFLAIDAPYILYANVDFEAKGISRELRKLLNQLRFIGPVPDWPKAKTIRFLKEHQQSYRRCLEWLTRGAVVDLRNKIFDDGYDEHLSGEWKRDKAVAFLQLHGLDHAGVALQPRGDHSEPGFFSGLELTQGSVKDPLDPICWQLLAMLSLRGTLFVKRCGYFSCGKYFVPHTARKQFCTDSCRALQHQTARTLNEDDEQEFRKERREYMRRHRAIPMVKLRIPKRDR